MSQWSAPTGQAESPAAQKPWLYFGAGMALALLLHVLMGAAMAGAYFLVDLAYDQQLVGRPIVGVVSVLGFTWLMGLSLVQLAYLGPVFVITWYWRRPMALGILMVATLTILLQGSCYGLFLTPR